MLPDPLSDTGSHLTVTLVHLFESMLNGDKKIRSWGVDLWPFAIERSIKSGEMSALLESCRQIPNFEMHPSVLKSDPVTKEIASVEEM